MSFKLSDLKEHNPELLELLTIHLPDILWVKDLEGKYLYANQAICEGLLMAKDTTEPIGKGDVFFALREREAHKDKPNWHTFGELCFNSDQVVIDNNKAMRFEEYGNVKGKLLYLEVYKAPFYDKDGNTIGTVGAGRDITELKSIQLDLEKSVKVMKEQRELLEHQATHDTLTSLPNRVLFMDRLKQSIRLSERLQSKVAVVFIDLDNFKEINDTLGHNIGDKVLIEASKRLRSRVRSSDTISRLGGDEFCILLNDIQNINDAAEVVKLSMASFTEPLIVDSSTLHLSLSAGISIYPHDGDDIHALLKNADTAMYKAKHDGKNRYYFYDEEMTKSTYEKIFLESELRKACEKHAFSVHFQPQMNAQTSNLVGMEVLARWEHPALGFISPDRFIPIAEANGMIIELDRIVMRQALMQVSNWKSEGLKPGKIAFNLSIKQLEQEDFVGFVKDITNFSGLSFSEIEFEVTETQIMKNPEASIKVLEEISQLGISIAIDDFGTGYSSLAYLKRLPINKLKIDKSFIDHLPDDSEDIAISKTIINLCSVLNLKVIAEGVETLAQQEFLLENNCIFTQGYFHSKPLSGADMTRFLQQ